MGNIQHSLDQSLPQPQSEPVPDSKPPIEIPVPNRNVTTHKDMQVDIENDVLIKDVCIFIVIYHKVIILLKIWHKCL